MTSASGTLRYSAALTPGGREDDWVIDAVSQAPRTVQNFREVGVLVPVADLRDGGMRPGLDSAGFEFVPGPTRTDHGAMTAGSEAALEEYRRETRSLLESLTGADDVVFFDATLRREDTEAARDPGMRSAHQRVHIDQNPRSAWARARLHGGPVRRFRRFQILNVWRPLLQPVRNYPLALCDYRSVDTVADLVPTRLEFPPWLRDRENYSVKQNPAHRWYHWRDLTPDEAIVFKCYDSASQGLALADAQAGSDDDDAAGSRALLDVSGLCPHTAFFDGGGPTTGALRTSLELRALVFYS